MKRKILVLIGMVLLLSACGGKGETTPVPDVSDQASSAAVQKVVDMLSADLNVFNEAILIKAVESVDWPNACLGISKPGESCAEVITPGYKITVSYNNQDYTYHTNADGSLVLAELETQGQIDPVVPGMPEAVANAKLFLSEQLKVKPSVIKTVSYEARNWPDGCLGIAETGVSCIQVITPGYLVTLEVDQVIYKLRTNLDGSLIKNDTTRTQPGTSDS